jgi:hypothetical protein
MITSHGRDPAIKSASTPTIVSGIDQGKTRRSLKEKRNLSVFADTNQGMEILNA